MQYWEKFVQESLILGSDVLGKVITDLKLSE